MKYTARVTKILKTSIHVIGAIVDDEVREVAEMALPDYIEIELEGEPDYPCMMYRYTDSGEFCGDTWHENLADALRQAEYEYGLSKSDFHLLQSKD